MSHEYVRNTPETKKRKRKIGATKERATDDRAENKYVSQESKIKIGREMLKVR